MKLTDEVLLQFGQRLMAEVRDTTIDLTGRSLDGTMKSADLQRLHRLVREATTHEEAVRSAAPFIIDLAMHSMLTLLENSPGIEIHIRRADGTTVRLEDVTDGLAGELYGLDGWIAKFSAVKDKDA